MSPIQTETTVPPGVAVPPTADQLPHTDGEPLESELHYDQMHILVEPLYDFWTERTDFYVGANMFLYYSLAQTKKNDFRGPDVFVVMDVERRERLSWDLFWFLLE